MNKSKKIIIHNFEVLFNILDEIKHELKYDVLNFSQINNDENDYDLIISRSKVDNFENQLILNEIPTSISKLIEKINILILKQNFKNQSKLRVGKYFLDINSRFLSLEKKTLKLTEQETKILIYLSKLDFPASINRLQKDVWGYESDLETHTVETHIHRLRKKILKIFLDDNLIVSSKKGYIIN